MGEKITICENYKTTYRKVWQKKRLYMYIYLYTGFVLIWKK